MSVGTYASALLLLVGAGCGQPSQDGPASIHGLEIAFDDDGFADGVATMTVSPRFAPGGMVAAQDGSLFVFGHADVGQGGDAGTSGRNVIIKLRPDGRAETEFGAGGVFVQSDVREGWLDLVVRPEGPMLALGYVDSAPALWQIGLAGDLDTAFGDGGVSVLKLDAVRTGGQSVLGATVLLRGDGSADLLGPTGSDQSSGAFTARIDSAGTIVFERALSLAQPDRWWGAAIDTHGATLVFGERWASDGSHPLVGRLTGDLYLDSTFAPEGYARIGSPVSDCLSPSPILGGRFAAAGTVGQGNSFGGALLVWTADGELDPAFGGDGHVPVDEDWVMAVGGLPSGAVLAQLQQLDQQPGPPEYVVRLSPAGAADPGFGEGGRSTGVGFAVDLAVTAAGDAFAAGVEWPDTVHVRALPTYD